MSGKTVLRWIYDGLLPARLTRPGGQYRLERLTVERFKTEQQQVHPKTAREDRARPKAS